MTFALQELEGILNEQKSFDLILSFSILPSPTPESASATVRILEDRELVVTLTHSGYTRTVSRSQTMKVSPEFYRSNEG